ncbi:hypothetical protein A3739_04390 [Oleiphilus sp. HI0067]|nr:hypothetical protein A3738_22190 [Oleiphilus sp. HI0066]KZY64481.1 hypothetical protein A3738_01590 [Oleiphilus sp. HI0066]KZY71637.1 hypothetical protein A3739_04390 [Oleiphilus sp. HI0067]
MFDEMEAIPMRTYIFIISLLFSMTGAASNINFLSSTEIGSLNDEEQDSLKAFVVNGLNNYKQLEKAEWKSKKGSRALFKIIADYKQGDTSCRRVKFAVKSAKHSRFQTMLWTLCQNGNRWQLSKAPLAELSTSQRSAIANDIFDTLDNKADGEPANFHYSDASLDLVAVPFDSPSDQNTRCRVLSLSILDDKSAMLSGKYRFCNEGDATWKYVGD